MTEANYLFDKIFKSNETKEKIFLINQRKGKSGVVAVEDFYNVISKLQVGPEQDVKIGVDEEGKPIFCLLYTSPSPRDRG